MAKIEDCPVFETFGADVKAARKDLAEKVNIESRYLANIENEGTIPSLPVVIQLIKICGLPCDIVNIREFPVLGRKCAFVGKVGNDMFGRLLRDTIMQVGIHTEGLVMDPSIPTTLAFVKTFENGDRDFSFYRKPGADMMLTESELPEETILSARIFHFGTLSMTHEVVRAATVKAVGLAKEGGAYVSFDPNLRPPLWDDLEDAKEAIAWGLSQCDILKIADNELEFMTGETDFGKGAAILHKNTPIFRC